MDAHHRSPHPYTGHLGLELALEFPLQPAPEMAHIGGRTAHVEADHIAMPRQARRACHAHNAPRRAAEDGILALEHMRIGKAAAALHEEEFDARHFTRHLLHVAAQDGREIGVHHGGVAPAHELHHRAGAVGGADLGEADLGGNTCGCGLMVGVAVAVHKHHGHTAQTCIKRGPQVFTQAGLIQRLDHVTVCAHPFMRFDDAGVEQLGQQDAAVEQAWAVLVGDTQPITEAACGNQ